MLVVISPAKRLDWAAAEQVASTAPDFQADAVSLATTAGRLSKPKLQELMSISPSLAKLTKDRFAQFEASPEAESTRPAMLAFAGDTYVGLEAKSLDQEAVNWAQDHLRILSGLYGLLRPLDAIQPYRLEMGSRLKTRKGASLYDYWGDRITEKLNDAMQTISSDILVNCASQEYFGAVVPDKLNGDIVTPVFLEDRPGGPKIVSFFAKKARGAMARFITERRLTSLEALKDFDTGGYSFSPERSEGQRLVFIRSEAAANAA